MFLHSALNSRTIFGLVTFTSKYFIFLKCCLNGVDSLISLSDFSLLVYRNASDFCVLILYPPLPILIHLFTSQEEALTKN